MSTRKLFGIVGWFFAISLVLALSAGPAAAQKGQEICNDLKDNDGDKLVDCKDPDCATSEFCKTPPPPPKVDADCSPGYYKKHPNTWDDGICFDGDALASGTDSNDIYLMLCAECGASAADRAWAKAQLDACFGTAEASPCTDDD